MEKSSHDEVELEVVAIFDLFSALVGDITFPYCVLLPHLVL
jgi:hypothetical protein